MTSPADLLGMQLCVDAEIARARLEELIADCSDADVIWLHDVVLEAMKQSAAAAHEIQAQPQLHHLSPKERAL